MKKVLKSLLVALGITTICSLWLAAPLLSPRHNAIYHWASPAYMIFVPVALDLAILWLLLISLILMAQRPGRGRVLVWSGIILVLPWIILKDYIITFEGHVLHLLTPFVLGSSVLAWLFLAVFWNSSMEPAFEHVQHFAATVFSFVGILGAVFLCQLAWFAWQARDLNAPPSLHRQQSSKALPAKPRILWIIFDELSHEQVYERTLPGLQLPAFDALAAEATTFTHTVPAGITTEDVVPSLMTGQLVDDIRSSSSGRRMWTHNPDPDVWQAFDQHRTVFQDALDAGYSTSVVGWANPYCRILPKVLDSCFWSAGNAVFPYRSIGLNMVAPLRTLAGNAELPVARVLSFIGLPAIDPHVADYFAIAKAADPVLADRTATFVLLHLPVPHPGGIYDRKTGRFSTSDATSTFNYLDNLVLADRYMAHVRAVLEQSGEWDSTAVLVMGDHSWRTKLRWVGLPKWTAEEQLASHGGQFDDRPAYIVKLPGQKPPAKIDTPFAAMRTRELFDQLLTGRIRTPQQLAKWAQ